MGCGMVAVAGRRKATQSVHRLEKRAENFKLSCLDSC